MLNEEKRKYLRRLLGEEGLAALLERLPRMEKMLEGMGVDYREAAAMAPVFALRETLGDPRPWPGRLAAPLDPAAAPHVAALAGVGQGDGQRAVSHELEELRRHPDPAGKYLADYVEHGAVEG